MKALIVDDDASTRFMVKRLIEENFGCEVAESGDGVEALELLARDRFAFVFLDLEMPTMNGIETLEEIRQSPATKDTPVIILSRERQEDAVVQLMRLGISDYLLKPLRTHLAVSKIEKVITMLPRPVMEATELDRIRLSADTPALLVDGNLDYRYFFASQVERFGRVAQADSGAAALSLCRRNTFPLIFIGDELGLVSPERLAQKLRELHPTGLRLIRIVDRPGVQVDPQLFDASFRRSYVPDSFRASVRPYVFIPGPFTALSEIVPELPTITSSAATQVFGMMFDSEILPSTSTEAFAVDFSAAIEILLDDRFHIKLGIHLPKASALEVASKMAGVPCAELTDDDCISVAGELSNIVTGRVHARFGEREMKSVCTLPELICGQGFEPPDEATGLVQRFAMPEVGEFMISIRVADRFEAARNEAKAAAEAKAATQTKDKDEQATIAIG